MESKLVTSPQWRAAVRVKDFLVRQEEIPADANPELVLMERIEMCADSDGFICARSMLLHAGVGSQLMKTQAFLA